MTKQQLKEYLNTKEGLCALEELVNGHEVDLSEANFENGDFEYTNFSKANLESAKLTHANLDSADMQHAKAYDAEMPELPDEY